jgi:16S rRNA (uracil1498-N3)-methyltransferase
MALPFFYKENIESTSSTIHLDEANSKHIVQVLRMKIGEQLNLTDGKGNLLTAKIIDDNRKKCAVAIQSTTNQQSSINNITIAISLLKNTTRIEWFLEKATEIGVTEIIPLICDRTEKTTFKFERLNGIVVSAMLQSQQCWLPKLFEPIKFERYIKEIKEEANLQKYIAHCEDATTKNPLTTHHSPLTKKLILIGPEGDFTKPEINLALQNNFTPVSLGNTRLRTETAGVVAATLLANAH